MDDNRLGGAMAAAIQGLLDAVPAARSVLPHLAALEGVLRTKGVDGIGEMPWPVLEKAAAQLSNLPLPAENVMLPHLLSLLDMAVQSRQARRPPAKASPDPFLSSFMTDEKLSVDEISYTEFANAVEAQEKRYNG